MPYRTPDASSYTMIKRLQTDISGRAGIDPTKLRAPSAYGGYFAGLSLAALPPNAITSNKFIQPEAPSIPVEVEVDFINFFETSAPVVFPSTTSVTMHFINVDTSGSFNTIIFGKDGYDFTGSTLNIISPEGDPFAFFDSGDGYIQFNRTDTSGISDWKLTLTVPTSISQIDFIAFQLLG